MRTEGSDLLAFLADQPRIAALEARVPELEQQLAKAKEELEDLDRKASAEAVPFPWRR